VRVVKQREGGIVRRVMLLDDAGAEVVAVTRFLSHLSDFNYSPKTVCAYAVMWGKFHPSLWGQVGLTEPSRYRGMV